MKGLIGARDAKKPEPKQRFQTDMCYSRKTHTFLKVFLKTIVRDHYKK